MAELILKRFKKIRRLNNVNNRSNGQVYLVEDTEENNKLYALKVIDMKMEQKVPRDYARNMIARKVKCMKEMRNSPNITVLHESIYVKQQDTFYNILQHCEGDNLYYYQRNYPAQVIPLNQAINILTHVLVGLEQLQMKGQLHRNIRPQNILIKHFEGKQIYKIADFGFSKHQYSLQDITFETSFYMSPELIEYIESKQSSQSYGFQVDVWAFAVLFFYMINRQHPFRYRRSAQYLRKHAKNFSFKKSFKQTCSFEKVNQIQRPYYPFMEKEIQDLFKRMFQLDPKQRITFQEIRKHPVFAPRYSQLEKECKKTFERQRQAHPLVKLLVDQKKNNTIAQLTEQELESNSLQRYFSLEQSIASGKIRQILFLKQNADEFLNSDGLLNEYEAFMISYNIYRYCAILLRNLKERFMQYKLKSKKTDLTKEDLLFIWELKKAHIDIKNHIIFIQQRLQILYYKCEHYLTQINQINSSFSSSFQKKTTEKAFEGNFKKSYDKSFNYLFGVLHQKILARKGNRVNYFIVICLISHVFNRLHHNKEQAADIFRDYLIEKNKTVDNINYYELRKWINNAQEALLDNISNKIISTYLIA